MGCKEWCGKYFKFHTFAGQYQTVIRMSHVTYIFPPYGECKYFQNALLKTMLKDCINSKRSDKILFSCIFNTILALKNISGLYQLKSRRDLLKPLANLLVKMHLLVLYKTLYCRMRSGLLQWKLFIAMSKRHLWKRLSRKVLVFRRWMSFWARVLQWKTR